MQISSPDSLACSTPALSSKASLDEFKIEEKSALRGEVFSNGVAAHEAKYVFDGEILPTISWANDDCHVGITLPEGYVGLVDEVSFFLNRREENRHPGHLFIEGSSDNFVTSETLATVKDEVHEG